MFSIFSSPRLLSFPDVELEWSNLLDSFLLFLTGTEFDRSTVFLLSVGRTMTSGTLGRLLVTVAVGSARALGFGVGLTSGSLSESDDESNGFDLWLVGVCAGG